MIWNVQYAEYGILGRENTNDIHTAHMEPIDLGDDFYVKSAAIGEVSSVLDICAFLISHKSFNRKCLYFLHFDVSQYHICALSRYLLLYNMLQTCNLKRFSWCKNV